MGKAEWDAYAELKQIYHSRDTKFNQALKNAGNDIYKREVILRKRNEECEGLASFCQSNTLTAEEKKDQHAWMKEANVWLGRQKKFERDMDELTDQMDDPPLPDRERKNGELVDIEYY